MKDSTDVAVTLTQIDERPVLVAVAGAASAVAAAERAGVRRRPELLHPSPLAELRWTCWSALEQLVSDESSLRI
jgi:hypothetical protein